MPNENFIHHLEEIFINWDDDADLMHTLILNYLSKPDGIRFDQIISNDKIEFKSGSLSTTSFSISSNGNIILYSTILNDKGNIILSSNNDSLLSKLSQGLSKTSDILLIENTGTTSDDMIFIKTNNVSYPKIAISSTDNIGIGISNPNALLHIHKNTTNSIIDIRLSDITTGSSSGILIAKDTTQNLIIDNQIVNGNIRFRINNNEILSLLTNGNIAKATPITTAGAIAFFRRASRKPFLTPNEE